MIIALARMALGQGRLALTVRQHADDAGVSGDGPCDHDPGNNHPRNLAALCLRCHLLQTGPSISADVGPLADARALQLGRAIRSPPGKRSTLACLLPRPRAHEHGCPDDQRPRQGLR